VNDVLKKLNLSEEEGKVLFSHFVKDYLKNSCDLDLRVDVDYEMDYYNKYIRVNSKFELKDGDEVIFSASSSSFT
jgi:hypothetical protein